MIDKEKIARFKQANEKGRAIVFNFFDAYGKFATETKRPYVRVEIRFNNGQEFMLTAAEFESLDDYGINVGEEAGKEVQ